MPSRNAAQVFVDDLEALSLAGEDAHHLAAVLRLRPGERVLAADGAGAFRPCVVAGEVAGAAGSPGGKRRAQLVLEAVGPVERVQAPAPALTIAFPLVKGDRPEWAVQKLTELGVDRIVPLLTGRAVVRPEGGAAGARVARLRRVAREAAMQSRRLFLPAVDELTSLPALLAGGGVAVADASGGPPSLDLPTVFVGPEGGFEEGEIPDDVPRVRLGANVLRTETAAVVAGALLAALRDGVVAPGAT